MCDFEKLLDMFAASEYIESEIDLTIDASRGVITISCKAKEGLYFKDLSEVCNNNIDDEYKLLAFVKKLSKSYTDYEGIRKAMENVKPRATRGKIPTLTICSLKSPSLSKKRQYGVKLKASAPSYHIVRVGRPDRNKPRYRQRAAERDLVKYLLSEFETTSRASGTQICRKEPEFPCQGRPQQ
jgi:stage IV sporulation protein A